MSKKRKKAEPVVMPKKEDNVILRIDGITATRKAMPKHQVQFRTGAHMSDKDRSRDKNWRNWE